MAISAKQIKELRDITGSGFLDCRTALEDSSGDFDKAVEFLRKKGLAKATKRAGRDASEGVVEIYNHGNGRVGVIVEVNCETDFVARSETFRKFAHEIALQVAASSPRWLKDEHIPADLLDKERDIARERAIQEGKSEDIVDRIVDGRIEKFKEENTLMRQAYIRDDKLSIQDYLHATISVIGENVVIRRFVRWEVGEQSK